MPNEAARWLKKRREGLNFSFRDLAKQVKLTHTTLSKAEEGEATTETWIKLADYFGESVLRVLYWAKKMKHPPSDDDVLLELQNRITVKILEALPQNEWENVLKHVVNDVEWLRQRQGNKNEVHSKKNP
jgi:transcriptional regulator with XRE-family HTH domain